MRVFAYSESAGLLSAGDFRIVALLLQKKI